MKRKVLLTLAAIIFCWLPGCSSVKTLDNITQVSITSDAGSIPDELQWHEEITITKDDVSFVRNGRTDETEVDEGSWDVPVGAQSVAALFAELEAVDCATIERVEPDDPLDGGETTSYTITYGRGKTFYLRYEPGVTYTDGARLVDPIMTFIEDLDLPAAALNRYDLSE